MALGANSGEAGPCCLHGGSLGLRLAFRAGSVQCLDELENVSRSAGQLKSGSGRRNHLIRWELEHRQSHTVAQINATDLLEPDCAVEGQ